MRKIRAIVEQDKFCLETVGVELLEMAPGWAKARLEIKKCHLNGLGTVQGGAIFTLADLALAAASNAHGRVAVLVSAGIDYFLAVSQGTLFAEATEISLNNKLATYVVRVADQDGKLIAQMQATVYRKREVHGSAEEKQEPQNPPFS